MATTSGGTSQGGSGFSSPFGNIGGGSAWSSKTTVLVVVGVIAVVLVLIIAVFFSRRPGGLKVPLLGGREPSAPELKKTYQNPFEKETQYVNPFAEFKSPFQSLQK